VLGRRKRDRGKQIEIFAGRLVRFSRRSRSAIAREYSPKGAETAGGYVISMMADRKRDREKWFWAAQYRHFTVRYVGGSRNGLRCAEDRKSLPVQFSSIVAFRWEKAGTTEGSGGLSEKWP